MFTAVLGVDTGGIAFAWSVSVTYLRGQSVRYLFLRLKFQTTITGVGGQWSVLSGVVSKLFVYNSGKCNKNSFVPLSLRHAWMAVLMNRPLCVPTKYRGKKNLAKLASVIVKKRLVMKDLV